MAEGLESGEQVIATELTPKLAADLLIYSFHLSQGSNELQAYIFQYLHLKYPGWIIGDEEVSQIIDTAAPVVEKYVFAAERRPELNTGYYKLHTLEAAQGIPLTHDIALETTKDELKVMQIIFGEKYKEDPRVKNYLRDQTQSNMVMNSNLSQSLRHIERLMQERDMEFILKGRSKEYFKDYVIEGKSTHIPVYDQMMHDVRRQVFASQLAKK